MKKELKSPRSKSHHTNLTNSDKEPYKQLPFERLNVWFEKKEKILFAVFCTLCLSFSFLLFSTRISEGGDDSTYIKAGYDYVKLFPDYFFSFNAPLYPMFLAIPIALGGMNIIFLKLLSVIFHFLSFLFFYKAFYKRLPHLVFYPVLFFFTVNYLMQYYASQTYNESFYLCFQSLFLYLFFKLNDRINAEGERLSAHWGQWLLIGFLSLILSLAKNMGIVVMPVACAFLMMHKKWKSAAYYALSFISLKIIFEIAKSAIWGDIAQYKSQGDILRRKDPYDASKGYDDLSGFIGRFFDNADVYLSKRFFQITGFMNEQGIQINPLLTLFVCVLFLIGGFYAFRKNNKALLLSFLITGALVCTTFIALQVRWDQSRLILVHMPVLLLVSFYGLYHLFQKRSLGRSMYIVLVVIFCLSVFISSAKRVITNVPILAKNLKGDLYYGYTPDWVNFLKMSQWCGENLPDTALVASRKASMSFIYAKGKNFYPIYQVMAFDTASKMSNPDSVLAIFKRSKVTHVIVASLRSNPAKADGNIINTIHRVLYPVIQKYPQKIKQVYQVPAPDQAQIEPAYLYEINY